MDAVTVEQQGRNKGGRPIAFNGVRVLAARHAPACVRVLGEVVEDAQAPAEARVAASQTLLGIALMQRAQQRPASDAAATG